MVGGPSACGKARTRFLVEGDRDSGGYGEKCSVLHTTLWQEFDSFGEEHHAFVVATVSCHGSSPMPIDFAREVTSMADTILIRKCILYVKFLDKMHSK